MLDCTKPGLFGSFSNTTRHEASTFLITLAALYRNMDVRFFASQSEAGTRLPLFPADFRNATFYGVSNGRKTHFLNGSQTDIMPASAGRITRNKLETKQLLHGRNLNTPVGGIVSARRTETLVALYNAGIRRFVLKPLTGSLGKGVHVNQTASQIAAMLKAYPEAEFLLEQNIVGREYRLFVAGGTVAAAYARSPIHVVGDGTNSIRALYEERQKRRATNPFTATRIPDEAALDLALLMRRRTWQDVPAKGEVVWLNTDTLPSGSGDFPCCIDTVSPKLKQLAIAATQAVSAPHAALDMILDTNDEPYVLELNLRPMIAGLSFPWPTGRWNLNAPHAILDTLFGDERRQTRSISGFDFAALRSEIFREGRKTRGVNAADFVEYA